jgi:hypothetical protein
MRVVQTLEYVGDEKWVVEALAQMDQQGPGWPKSLVMVREIGRITEIERTEGATE